MEGGPLMLSWQDVRAAGRSASLGYNVVIHEFAHVLDMADGLATACRSCRRTSRCRPGAACCSRIRRLRAAHRTR